MSSFSFAYILTDTESLDSCFLLFLSHQNNYKGNNCQNQNNDPGQHVGALHVLGRDGGCSNGHGELNGTQMLKGTGNSEIILDRKLSDKRVYPAIDITKSGTRKEDLLVGKDILSKMYVLRRIINPMGTLEAMEFLLDKLRLTKTNDDFFSSMNQ